MKNIRVLIVMVIALSALSGCSSFRQIDTTDVIPTQAQAQTQLKNAKTQEGQYNASKQGYPETLIKPVTQPTTTTQPPSTKASTTTTTPVTTTPAQPVKPVNVADLNPTTATTPSSNVVVISSTSKKPIREIIIYPDDVTTPTNASKTTTTAASTTTTVIKNTNIKPTDTPTTVATETLYKVLVGKFPSRDATEPLLNELKETYKEAFVKKNEEKEEYSVQIAASSNKKSVDDLVERLRNKGYKVFIQTIKK